MRCFPGKISPVLGFEDAVDPHRVGSIRDLYSVQGCFRAQTRIREGLVASAKQKKEQKLLF